MVSGSGSRAITPKSAFWPLVMEDCRRTGESALAGQVPQ